MGQTFLFFLTVLHTSDAKSRNHSFLFIPFLFSRKNHGILQEILTDIFPVIRYNREYPPESLPRIGCGILSVPVLRPRLSGQADPEF